jgi:acetate kinase
VAVLTDDVLVVNAGSTSLKLSVVDRDEVSRQIAALGDAGDISAVGHRIVHGGSRFIEPTPLDDDIVSALDELCELAPLHNPPAVDAIRRARQELPNLPHVAVFDTAFHHTIPPLASTYLLPERYRALGIRRFGFHGLSVAWVAEQVPVARLVVCHLGGGCSVTAVRDGRSVDTTMGFTPLEGVPMATRPGPVDPGALLYLLRLGVTPAELEQALEHESGLLALGGTADVASLVASSADGPRLALEIFAYRVAQAVAAMSAALGGLDAVAFTGGVGEHALPVRSAICERLRFLGVGERVPVHVIAAREDAVIARAVRLALGLRARRPADGPTQQ